MHQSSSSHKICALPPSMAIASEPLGVGGMAIVYRVTDSHSGKSFALKAEKEAKEQSSSHPIIHEFTILKELASVPGVVKVFDLVSLPDGRIGFTMELLEGAALDTMIAAHTLPSEAERIELLVKLADTLSAVHDRGIVLCDLKPSNLYVSGAPAGLPSVANEQRELRRMEAATNTPRITILDLGIAHRLSDPTPPKAMKGTVAYLSPEQIRGDSLTPASDIYSFGVLAFELLTGTRPFPDDSTFTTTASHLAASVPSVCLKVSTLPSVLDDMIHICLEKRPEDRFSSAAEIATLLRKAQKALTAPPSTAKRLWNWFVKDRSPAA